ncbi:hypothetical protein GW17_00054285 [Ensete ventricosum]|nr:hypothetical protein GW17_00054285 [Ensete ventricosum]
MVKERPPMERKEARLPTMCSGGAMLAARRLQWLLVEEREAMGQLECSIIAVVRSRELLLLRATLWQAIGEEEESPSVVPLAWLDGASGGAREIAVRWRSQGYGSWRVSPSLSGCLLPLFPKLVIDAATDAPIRARLPWLDSFSNAGDLHSPCRRGLFFLSLPIPIDLWAGGGDDASSQCCSRRSTSAAEHSLIDPSHHHRSGPAAHLSPAHNCVALPDDCGLCAHGLFWSLRLSDLRLPLSVDASTTLIYLAPIHSAACNFCQGLLAHRTHRRLVD